MKIAIIGTVGVPARYGGFETLAEQLAFNVSPEEHELIFYGQRSAYPEIKGNPDFAGHRRVFLPLRANGPQSLVHDMFAMAHSIYKVRPDVMLVLGYSGAWFLPLVRLMRPEVLVVTNIDGMEWRRDKFHQGAKVLLRILEWFATRFSHRVIADNEALIELVHDIHGIDPILIAYGGDHTLVEPEPWIELAPGYGLAIARIEPENNCHLILEACHAAGHSLVFVGNWEVSSYGKLLKTQFSTSSHVLLLDPIYDVAKLSHLRSKSGLYIHGHSVGGTNPSLVEAIFHHDRILSFDCIFNRKTLYEKGEYFTTAEDLQQKLSCGTSGKIDAYHSVEVRQSYIWKNVVKKYFDIFRF